MSETSADLDLLRETVDDSRTRSAVIGLPEQHPSNT